MPIIPTKAANANRQAFEAGLAHLVRLGRVSTGLEVDPNPQPVYVLSVKGAGQVPEIADAKLVAWRFFAGEASGEIVEGEVSTQTAPPVVNSMRYGPSAKNISSAMQQVEKLPDVEHNDFSLRILRIPEALVEGFWLKRPSGGNDLIVPYGKTFGTDRQDDRPQDLGTFLTTLHPVGKAASSREGKLDNKTR